MTVPIFPRNGFVQQQDSPEFTRVVRKLDDPGVAQIISGSSIFIQKMRTVYELR